MRQVRFLGPDLIPIIGPWLEWRGVLLIRHIYVLNTFAGGYAYHHEGD